MYTGIVQCRGRVAKAERVDFGLRLSIDPGDWPHKPIHGESINVSGCCLTVNSHDGAFTFDVIAQTLTCTTLGRLAVDDPVNLEPCVTATSLLGGHIVQGHVDGVGEVVALHRGEDEVRVTIQPPDDLLEYIIPKGSISVDGVSLTLAEVHPDRFEVALIPTTLDLTTLGLVEVGSKVNLEADMMVKTIVHLMKQMGFSKESAKHLHAALTTGQSEA